MKKFFQALAILLSIALMGGAIAVAESSAKWSNGQCPDQPYAGVPPVDLTKKLGYMVLDPLNNETLDTAVNALHIYLPRGDAVLGDGTLRLYEKGIKDPIREISFADGDRVSLCLIDEGTCAWLIWEGGIQVTIALDNALDAGKTYSVSLDPNSIVVPEYGIGNTALDGDKGWTFTTGSASGVVGRARSGEAQPRAGDSVAVEVKLGEGVASAMLFFDSEAMTTEDEPLTQTGTLTAVYGRAGPVRWGVALMDASGQIVSAYRYSEEVLPG